MRRAPPPTDMIEAEADLPCFANSTIRMAFFLASPKSTTDDLREDVVVSSSEAARR